MFDIKQPLGICAGITPFNFPAMVPMWMFPLSIACGNAFMLKPSEKVPQCSLKLAELMSEAGLPDNVLTVVNGDKNIVDLILQCEDISSVSFVGSTPVAKYIYTECSKTNKRVQALGGAKNHMLIMEDANLEDAVNGLIGAAFGSAGERCMATSVAMPVGNIQKPFMDLLKEKASKIKVGESLDPQSEMGPLITKEHKQKVLSYIEKGVEEGAKLEQKLKDIAKKYKLQIIGPNCLGVMNLEPQTMMNSTFLKITPKSGEIALVSQSGAICAALVEDASAQGIGFSAVISMGNKADMSEIDILKMLAEHKQTKVIVIYLEDMGNGQEFLKVCKDITRKKKKPVLVLKSGRSPEGAKAAMSHTGALMGSDEIYDALLKQSGAIRVDTMEELFDYATAFSKQPLPMNGDLVIVSIAGGPAIISTDACSKLGIKMAKIEEIRKKIDAVIPPWGS